MNKHTVLLAGLLAFAAVGFSASASATANVGGEDANTVAQRAPDRPHIGDAVGLEILPEPPERGW